ncbi:membrane trafficking VPS53 family protein [Actinidia rufa]|uniref:Membrane trafficking VPS53 family protein n=1 Tax=Actinidia rufa TaxID=165716 RepID=A0A7J0GF06_9ERIC|nr:membrane trafficking VPS53 family protein [Actinidia rufa]
MSEVQDEFSAIITKALVTLVHGLETKFDAEMAAMTHSPWGTLESVGDQSEYINSINMILSSSIPALGKLLSTIYFQFFLDKMLLDTQAIKTILLDIPSLGRQVREHTPVNVDKAVNNIEVHIDVVFLAFSWFITVSVFKGESARPFCSKDAYASHKLRKKRAKGVPWANPPRTRRMPFEGSAQIRMAQGVFELPCLGVILSPVDSVADTYHALLPEGTPLEFQRILELKGLKRADQQSILDDFDKRGPGITQPPLPAASVVPAVPTAPAVPAISNISAASTSVGGAIATSSREDSANQSSRSWERCSYNWVQEVPCPN